jgi:hypothetical protein
VYGLRGCAFPAIVCKLERHGSGVARLNESSPSVFDLGARQLVEQNRVAHGRPARCACRSRRGRRDQPPAPHPEACAECRRASTSVARRTGSGRMLTVTLTNDLDGTVYGIIQGCDRPTGLVVCSSAHYLMFSQFRVAGGLAASLFASFAASQEYVETASRCGMSPGVPPT